MERTLTLRPSPVAKVRAGATAGLDAEDFPELVRVHQRRIYRVLLGLTRDPDTADTLTQECFLRAFRKRRSFRGESSIATWLVRIAVNLAHDHARSAKNSFWQRLFRRDPGQDLLAQAGQVPSTEASPERVLAARQRLGAVWAATDALSEQQRTVFHLRFAEEMSLEEIALATGLELGTVKTHLHRAVGAIRQKFRGQQLCKSI